MMRFAYLLLDEKDCDMGWDGDLTHGDVPQERRLTDTITTDNTITATGCKGKGGTRPTQNMNLPSVRT